MAEFTLFKMEFSLLCTKKQIVHFQNIIQIQKRCDQTTNIKPKIFNMTVGKKHFYTSTAKCAIYIYITSKSL